MRIQSGAVRRIENPGRVEQGRHCTIAPLGGVIRAHLHAGETLEVETLVSV